MNDVIVFASVADKELMVTFLHDKGRENLIGDYEASIRGENTNVFSMGNGNMIELNDALFDEKGMVCDLQAARDLWHDLVDRFEDE